ncbi:MAG: hypothetical protein JST42_21605, partial [Bacteroidetes bacterium]|nr:hypothetical protein [Bacteroidota bacterium]
MSSRKYCVSGVCRYGERADLPAEDGDAFWGREEGVAGAMVEAILGEVFGEQIGKEMTDYSSWEKTAVYWTLVALGHVFFGRVLWKAFLVGGEGDVAREGVAPGVGAGVEGTGVRGAGVEGAGVEGAGFQKEEKLKDGRPSVGITILP